MDNETLKLFLTQYKVPRAVFWNPKAESFFPRAYSATQMALQVNADFAEFKNRV